MRGRPRSVDRGTGRPGIQPRKSLSSGRRRRRSRRKATSGASPPQDAPRTLGRDGALSARARVREAAERDKQVRFTALLHHVYNVEHLRAAYHALKRDAAPGIDGERWRPYGEALEENLADLSGRLKRGAYRAKPVKRTYIPKADGRQRPLGIPTLEDKIVQRSEEHTSELQSR